MATADYAKLAAWGVLRDKARKAVEQRKYTGRPGSVWHITEVGAPRYCGTFGNATIYPSDDGKAYDVFLYDSSGNEVTRRQWKGLDAAFRNGEKLADDPQAAQR